MTDREVSVSRVSRKRLSCHLLRKPGWVSSNCRNWQNVRMLGCQRCLNCPPKNAKVSDILKGGQGGYEVNKKMEGEKKSDREVELYLGSQLVYAPEVEFL